MPEKLKEMLEYKRSHGSDSEQLFIEKYILPLEVEIDEAGNLYKRIGNDPILWSSHTDTVHSGDGFQKVRLKNHIFTVKNSSCLGADDCAGMWIMMEMIKRGKQGLYIFHRGEERGGIGSSYIAKNTPELLNGIKYAVAFDRKGTNSIITHQYERCCSDEFADSMASQMPGFKKDTGGVFTDTANYIGIVPECTNISVGYQNEHSRKEFLDFYHLNYLKNLMLNLDTLKLVCKRDPDEIEYDESYYGYSDGNTLLDIIYDNPEAVSDLLKSMGYTAPSLKEELGLHVPF